MTPQDCMINLMADLIGLDDTYSGAKLNDPDIWDRFMQVVFQRMDQITDEPVRSKLDSIDTEDFQTWIDDPRFWSAVNAEIDRRINVVKTLLPSPHQGHC